MIGAYTFANSFKKNCPNVTLTVDELGELARLFKVAQDEAEKKGFKLGLQSEAIIEHIARRAAGR